MEESTPEPSLLAGLPCRGTLVAGACLLPGAPRRFVGAPSTSSAAGPRIVRTEVLSLDQWYKRSLRFRSAISTGTAAGVRARGKPGPNPATPATTSSAGAGGAAAAGVAALEAAAAAVAAGGGKRAAPWPAGAAGPSGGEDARGAPDQTGGAATLAQGGGGSSTQQQQPHKRPAGPGGRVVGAGGSGGGGGAGPSGQQQQQQAAAGRRVPPGAGAPAPAGGAGSTAPAAAAGRAQARHEAFTPEQLQAKTAKELSEMLKARGQSGAGRKEHLVIRLLDFQRRMRRAMQPT